MKTPLHLQPFSDEEIHDLETKTLVMSTSAMVCISRLLCTIGKRGAEAQQIRMQYLGVLNFVCEHSVFWANIHGEGDADEARETLERILDDAAKVIPRLRWKRILSRFEIELASR